MNDIIVRIGDYELTRVDSQGSWWLQNNECEGMEVSDEKMEKLFDDYFKENF